MVDWNCRINPVVKLENGIPLQLADKYENQYTAKRLGNWEQPKWYPPKPRQRKGSTKIVSNDAGHLLPTVKRVDNNPWGNFRSTYQLPEKLTRRFVKEYDDCLTRRDKWRHFPQQPKHICEDTNNNQLGITGTSIVPECQTKCETTARLLSGDKDRNRILNPCDKSLDLEYVPGDFTPSPQQHESRKLLLQQKYERDNDIDPELPLDKLYLGETDHDCNLDKLRANHRDTRFTVPRPLTAALTTSLSPPLQDLEPTVAANQSLDSYLGEKMPQQTITAKPNERCPSPVVPAYANFELARRMHNDNLDHQPLPDCVADAAYRKLQMSGGYGGLALDIDPYATGVGVKMHNAGPTHCTKMKVYRPKTCGVVPKVYDADAGYRYTASAQSAKKMGAMDLAICWDYNPSNVADEPQQPKHIDGSNDSAGPAVFNYVQTPRDEPAVIGTTAAGRSGGVFTNTVGELDFFNKDIMRRKTDFTGRNIELDNACNCGLDAQQRARSVSRNCHGDGDLMPSRYGKQYQSSPNITPDQEYKAIREKYLGGNAGTVACKRGNPGFFQRARTRLCHKVAPAEPACCYMEPHSHYKPPLPAFRAGVPKYNAAGHFVSSDSGCSMGSNTRCKVIAVPQPRNPYAKRNYDIDTLVPPFRSYGGGAGEGGYPEHWRLASVYQHAYKPLEQRRRPLLQSVYK